MEYKTDVYYSMALSHCMDYTVPQSQRLCIVHTVLSRQGVEVVSVWKL